MTWVSRVWRTVGLAVLAIALSLAAAATPAAAAPWACPCSIWGSGATPRKAAERTDDSAIEVGVKFRSEVAGRVTALRFYKGPTNTGTHVGHLWTRTGTLLATATFTNESATGWQQVNLSSPVDITADTTYVASYHAPRGNYAVNEDFFAGGAVVSPPLRALRDGADGGNGVYRYGPSGSFPTGVYRTENYWIDIVFDPNAEPDTNPPSISSLTPAANATGVSVNTHVTASFDEPMNAASISSSTFQLRNAAGDVVPTSVSYDGATRTATLDPSTALAASSTYTATVQGGAGGVKDSAGNALAADRTRSFTTAGSVGSNGPGQGTFTSGGQTAPGTSLRLIDPFPVVRISGRFTRTGTTLTRVTVNAPGGARIRVDCTGSGCPYRRKAIAVKVVRVRALQRSYRPGATIEIRVTRPRKIGKYTRIKTRQGKAPLRIDRCLMPGSTRPVRCPTA